MPPVRGSKGVTNAFNQIAMNKLLQHREITITLSIVVICIAASIAWPSVFPTFGNLSQLFLNISIETIVACGMMILLISGAFDLSVGSVVALSGGVTGYLLFNHGMYPLPAILLGVGTAALVGLVNGYLVAYVGINPMIQTLAMMGIVRGAAMMVSGSGIQNLHADFTVLGQMKLMGFQSPVWIMLAIVLILHILVSRHVFFRQYYYIGSNEKAAMLSGIRVKRLKLVSFVLVSVLAGIAGVLLAARMGAALGTSGRGMELRVITAAILGGASLLGGTGKVLGALLGTIFMGLISNVLIIARVSGYWQDVVLGVILIVAVWLDLTLKKQSAKSLTKAISKK